MNPLLGFALAHPDQPSRHHWEGVRHQGDQDTQLPILGHGPWTIRLGRLPLGGTRPSIEAPCGHLRLEGGCQREHQRPQLRSRETGQITPLGRAGLDVGHP